MSTSTHDEREQWQGPIAWTFIGLLVVFVLLAALREVLFVRGVFQ